MSKCKSSIGDGALSWGIQVHDAYDTSSAARQVVISIPFEKLRDNFEISQLKIADLVRLSPAALEDAATMAAAGKS